MRFVLTCCGLCSLAAVLVPAVSFLPDAAFVRPVFRTRLHADSVATSKAYAKTPSDNNVDDDYDEEDVDEMDFVQAVLPDESRESPVSRSVVENMNVNQLKQQLRLRGLKVSGRKSELVD